MWYDCQWDNFSQETKMTEKLTTIVHGTASNNALTRYHKSPRNDKCKNDNIRTNCINQFEKEFTHQTDTKQEYI